MYHVAPSHVHDLIMTRGIDYRLASSTYRDERRRFERANDMGQYPAGNFLTPSLTRAQGVGSADTHRIYEVDVTGLQLKPDPDTKWAGESYYSVGPISPGRIRLVH